MTIRHIRIFLEVYRLLNITKAAQALHMTQPAVSRAIQEIERYYGVCLFERLNRRLYVTENGHALYAYALHISDTFGLMEKTLLNWDAVGVLRVGASITIGNYELPELAHRFKAEKPELRLKVTIANGARLEEMLLSNQLDLALIEGHARHPELTARQYAGDQLSLIYPPNHPLAALPQVFLRDLLAYDLLLRETGSAGRSYLDQTFEAHGLSVQPQWESASTQALVRAVALGLGISVLPEQLVREDIQKGAVGSRPIEDAPLRRPHNLVWHRNKYLTASAKRFMALCLEGAGRLTE